VKFGSIEKTEVRYVLAGIWNSLFGIALFASLMHLFSSSLNYGVILGFSYTISIVQSHFVQRKYVWSSNFGYRKELFRFGLVYVGQFIANLGLLAFMVEVLEQKVLPSQIIITGFLIGISFLINKKWTFSG
jgi:putative flippase GtrA